MKYVYPAVFTREEGSVYRVVVPDLPGCVTYGDNLADTIEMGRDAMAMWLCDAEAQYEDIPASSDMSAIECDSDSFVNLIDVDTEEYRQQNDTRAVKKTLTIPAWLNSRAEKAGVNFSHILQEALKSHLGVDDRANRQSS